MADVEPFTTSREVADPEYVPVSVRLDQLVLPAASRCHW